MHLISYCMNAFREVTLYMHPFNKDIQRGPRVYIVLHALKRLGHTVYASIHPCVCTCIHVHTHIHTCTHTHIITERETGTHTKASEGHRCEGAKYLRVLRRVDERKRHCVFVKNFLLPFSLSLLTRLCGHVSYSLPPSLPPSLPLVGSISQCLVTALHGKHAAHCWCGRESFRRSISLPLSTHAHTHTSCRFPLFPDAFPCPLMGTASTVRVCV